MQPCNSTWLSCASERRALLRCACRKPCSRGLSAEQVNQYAARPDLPCLFVLTLAPYSMASELRAAELRLNDAQAQLARRAEDAQVPNLLLSGLDTIRQTRLLPAGAKSTAAFHAFASDCAALPCTWSLLAWAHLCCPFSRPAMPSWQSCAALWAPWTPSATCCSRSWTAAPKQRRPVRAP